MSTLTTGLLVAAGGAVGAPLRFALSRFDGVFPTGLLIANTIGSGLFGVFAALALGDATWALLGTGFCGAFTSFSSFAVQSVERPRPAAATYVIATTALAVGACALGWVIGASLV